MKNNNYNLIVIGGGPAGMMAAGHAAEQDARVLLVKIKYNSPVEKIIITEDKNRL